MKLDKYKIKKSKIGFLGICFFFAVGLLFVAKIFDFFTETVEIDAVVIHTYETRHNQTTHNPGGSEMNIEWTDLNGEIQKEGNISNKDNLSEGDSYTISVDAETQSRRVPSKTGSVILFVIGIVSCMVSLKMMQLFYGVD